MSLRLSELRLLAANREQVEMAIGFTQRFDFTPIIGWELYQVTIDKYHIMFWFEAEHALLNVADRFSFRSSDGAVSFSYEIYGGHKSLDIDRILRTKIAEARTISKDQLDLVFENGDVLSIYDNPEFRSWWFLGGRQNDPITNRTSWSFAIGDQELEDLTEQEYQDRRT
jgi:hypothetical protein